MENSVCWRRKSEEIRGDLGSAEKFSILERRSVSVKEAFLSGICIPGREEEGVWKYFRSA